MPNVILQNALPEADLWRACWGLGGRDIQLAWQRRDEFFQPFLFFLLVTALFPLALSPAPDTLRQLAPGILWLACLLAVFLSLDRLFRDDFDDGSLERLLLSPHPLAVLISVRLLVHCLVCCLPLLLAAPLAGLMLGMPPAELAILGVGLLLGLPILSSSGAIAVALTTGMSGQGVLLALLTLPLQVPVLIFGSGACLATRDGLDSEPFLLLLAALLLLTVSLSPFALAQAIRLRLQ